MKKMKLDRLDEAALHQLTGCRYAVLHALYAALCESIPKTARDRPIKRTLWAQLALTLIKPDRYGEVFRAVAVIHNFKLQYK